MSNEIIGLRVSELATEMQRKALSSAEATEAYLGQMEKVEPHVKAYLHITAERAMERAKAIDERRAKDEALPPLAGVPAALKDNMCTRGVVTTCASKMMEHFTPPYQATVVDKLEESGAVFLGKLNMDEFAMGSSTESSYFHLTHNPHDLGRVPGGSSGGSAAAVAAREAAYTLGSDTGGSIRQPASFCGVVGMKPTYGTVSRNGLVAFASSLDQIGPLTKDVRDNALVLQAIAGHDPLDTNSLRRAYGDFAAGLGQGVKGMKLAVVKEFFGEGLSGNVRRVVESALERYRTLGAAVEEVSLPSLTHALPTYYVISSAEASSNLACFSGVGFGHRTAEFADIDELYERSRSEGFGREVKRRIMLGTFALSAGYYDAYYKKALQVRTLIMRDFDRVFSEYDAIVSPVAPTTAYRIGEKTQDPLEMYLGDAYTVPVNVAGIPALSMPCGFDEERLPVGMQLMGKAFSEAQLYRIAYAWEQDAHLPGDMHSGKGVL